MLFADYRCLFMFKLKSAFLKIIYCGFFIALFSCQNEQKNVTYPVDVTAMVVEPKTIPAIFEYVAVAQSSHQIEIRSRVEGYLQSINYKEGSVVELDDLLFEIDPRPFQVALESEQGKLDQQQAILWNAEQLKSRMIPLYELNAVSENDFDNAIASELAAKANVSTAAANVNQALLNLSYTTITAPIKAIAGESKYREGALIAAGGSLLTTLYVIDPIWINFSIADRDLLKTKDEVAKKRLIMPENMNFLVDAVLSDGTIYPIQGVIDFTNPALQQSTGTLLIRSVFSNPNGSILPGQFLKVILKGAIRPNSIIIPQTAISQGASGPFVYVIKDSIAHKRSVELGDWYDDYWIVNSGLEQGDVVVVIGVNKIKEETEVNIVKTIPIEPKIQKTQGTQGNTIGF